MSELVRVCCEHRVEAERLVACLEAVSGRSAEVRAVAGGYVVEVVGAASRSGGDVVLVHGPPHSSRRDGLAIELRAEEAETIDVARLLGPVLRGRVSHADLTSLVDTYRSLQSVGARLDAGEIGLDTAEAELPELFDALRSDLQRPDILELWGTSTTVDDGTQQVPAALITFFAEQLAIAPDPGCCHAGLVHTYGYLLSPAPTEFGRKRHRWSSQEAAHVLGMSGRWPLGPDGVLTKLTETLCELAPLDDGAAPSSGDTGSLQVRYRVEDGGEVAGTRWRSRTRVIGTTADDHAGTCSGDELLLVYSVAVDDQAERYVTAFPVSSAFAVNVTAAPVRRLRFNAVLPTAPRVN